MQAPLIPDSRQLTQKISAFQQGVDRLCVVSDWDRTLMRAHTPDGQATTSYLAVVHGGYLGAGYREEMDRLYARYRKVEVADDVPEDEKHKQMDAWWRAAFDLLSQFGFTREMVADLVGQGFMILREGAIDFLQILSARQIPLRIVSAGIGDLIEAFLIHRNLLTPNVQIKANRLVFGHAGRVTGSREPMVHSLNKNAADTTGHFVLLLGDTLDDAKMVDDADCEGVIRIGFLNAETAPRRAAFLKTYDAVVEGDGDMGFVNEILRLMAFRG